MKRLGSIDPRTLYLLKLKAELTPEVVDKYILKNMHVVREQNWGLPDYAAKLNFVANKLYKERFGV